MKNKEELVVSVVAQETNDTLVVKDYDNLLETLQNELKEFVDLHLAITDDIELSQVKEFRTKIRKAKEKVKGERDAVYSQFVGTFCNQCLTIEKEIDSCDKTLKAVVDNYVERNTPKVITLEVKSYDLANINAVKSFAVMLGLKATIK